MSILVLLFIFFIHPESKAQVSEMVKFMFSSSNQTGVSFVRPKPGDERKLIGSWQMDYCISGNRFLEKKSGKTLSPCRYKDKIDLPYEFLPNKNCKMHEGGTSSCRLELKDGYFQVFESKSVTDKEEPTAIIIMDKDSHFYALSREELFVKLIKK